VVALRKRRDDHNSRAWLAWHVAALTRWQKALPKLETMLEGAPVRTRQTVAEQSAMWQVIAARFGGKFVPLDPKTVTRGH
jgi:hypothetical protein